MTIKSAMKILCDGGLVAFPTETVYGLGADASNESAVQKIFRAKGRPANHPLIVHLADVDQLEEWANPIPLTAFHLAEVFWPGPLTMILPKQPHVLDSVTANQPTVGIRVPKHPVAHALLTAFGSGVAAPSANKFTHISPTTAAAVYEELQQEVDMILDGGDCEVGLESTIVDLSGDEPVILRPGMISREAIATVLGSEVAFAQESKVLVPGMHPLHYAPRTKTRLIASNQLTDVINAVLSTSEPIAIVKHKDTEVATSAGIHMFSMPEQPHDYARILYRTLRTLDQQNFKLILIEDVPEQSEWHAIKDRLFKATGSD